MPRASRVGFPGARHHVMARGIEWRPFFLDDEDRRRFLWRLHGDLTVPLSSAEVC